MYVLNEVLGRGRRSMIALAVRENPDASALRPLLSELLPGRDVEALSAADLEALRGRLAAHAHLASSPALNGEDLLGGLAVFLLVVATTFPVALPFLLLSDVALAMTLSRGLALLLLFLSGYGVGRYSGLRPLPVGLAMLGVGAVLVAVVIALGG